MAEQIKVESPIIFKGKRIKAGTILTPGVEITEEEKEILLGVGKEVSLAGAERGAPQGELITAAPGLTAEEAQEARAYILELEASLKELRTAYDDQARLVKVLQGSEDDLEEQLSVAGKRIAELEAGPAGATGATPLDGISAKEMATILKSRKVAFQADAPREELVALVLGSAQPPESQPGVAPDPAQSAGKEATT